MSWQRVFREISGYHHLTRLHLSTPMWSWNVQSQLFGRLTTLQDLSITFADTSIREFGLMVYTDENWEDVDTGLSTLTKLQLRRDDLDIIQRLRREASRFLQEPCGLVDNVGQALIKGANGLRNLDVDQFFLLHGPRLNLASHLLQGMCPGLQV